jgi:arginase
MKEKKRCIITSEWELGAGKMGTSNGPSSILQHLESSNEEVFDEIPVIEIKSNEIANAEQLTPFLKNGAALLEHQHNLAFSVAKQLKEGYKCLLLTADHSNGIGGVSGLAQCVPIDEIGVIWIDAHFDLHSPYTTPSGNSHGMTVNALLNNDNKCQSVRTLDKATIKLWEGIKLIKGNAGLPPENLIFVDVRDFEGQEAHLVEESEIAWIKPSEIKENGIEACIEKIFATLSHCNYLYVSFDVDSLDTDIAKATGTPVDGGLQLEQAQRLIEALVSDSRTQCLEITEFNPELPHPELLLPAIEILLRPIL